MTEHTKEPWTATFRGAVKARNKTIAHCWTTEDRAKTWEADATRIVACVNALAGIDDPEAFMRDVRVMLEFDEDSPNFLEKMQAVRENIEEHLKGGE